MVDEYSVLDTRYWVVQDVCVTIVSYLEFIVMAPLCFLWSVCIMNIIGIIRGGCCFLRPYFSSCVLCQYE